MDLLCMHAKSNAFFVKGSMSEKPICWSSRNQPVSLEIKVARTGYSPSYSRCPSLMVKAMAKKNTGNSSNSNSNSNSSSGNNDHTKSGGDGVKGNSPTENHKNSDSNSQKAPRKPLDWREFRALLYIQEQADKADSSAHSPTNKALPASHSLPLKWAHPISSPENGCLLVATEKLDGVRTFERTVVLLLKSGTRNPQEGPFGIVINRPLNKKMKHINPTSNELATTFADCPLHFGGPLEASMFLMRAGEKIGLRGFEEVIPGVYFGARNSLDEASTLVKKGTLRPHDFGFFMGYAGWQLDQLREEIESDYWYVAACSENLIAGVSQNSSSDSLWQEILQLMGGHYSELSRKPKQDI